MSLALLTYVHYAFTHHPINCLKHLTAVHHDWLRDGIVRVEVIRNAPSNYTLMDSYHKEFAGYKGDLFDDSLAAVPTGGRG